MKRYFAPLVLLLVLTGCATGSRQTLPALTFLQTTPESNDCSRIFPRGQWQFVHSIHFSRHGESGTEVMGVTALTDNMLKTALVTVEGLTLFAADFYPDNSFQVHRAVPPFDNPNFAEGMMRDIRTIFQAPETVPRYGETETGDYVCRYTDHNQWVTDILLMQGEDRDDCWRITRYTPDRVRELSIRGGSCQEKGSRPIPGYLKLQTYGRMGYTLKMKLISAERLE